MRTLVFGALVALAACGGSGVDLPEGQHNLGDGVSVAVHRVLDPAPAEAELGPQPGNRWVAIDLEYFNRTDEVVDMMTGFRLDMRTSDNRDAVEYANSLPDAFGAIPAGSSLRGWKVYQVPDGVNPANLIVYGVAPDDDLTVIDLLPLASQTS